MHKYTGLIDKLIIFTCCLVVYLYQTDLEIYAATVLISFISGCLLSYFDDYRVKTFITVGFSLLAFIFPEFMVFLPLIAFDMIFHNLQAFNLLALIPLVGFFSNENLMLPLIVLIMVILSIILRYHVETGRRMDTRHKELIDTAREMSIQLSKQNRDLLEKQDNELNLATMNERNRIAREIHDNVGHLLSSAILQAGALKTINRDVKLNDNLQDLHETLVKAMNSIRNSVHELYDESLDLEAKVAELIKNFTFCEIDFSYNISGNPDKKLKYAFISILKEALTNIINHSDATKAIVAFNEHPALYQLIIRDNGNVKSFNTGDGMGISNMIDRVRSLNGNINIKTTNGFEIFISIPKEV
jgi:signal transduction histidine kinase